MNSSHVVEGARMPPTRKAAVTSGPELAASLEDALFQIKRVVVGQERLVERAMLALLTGGHCLIEGVPGLAKTLTVSTLPVWSAASSPASSSPPTWSRR